MGFTASLARSRASFKGLGHQFLSRFVLSCLLVSFAGGYVFYSTYRASTIQLRTAQLTAIADNVTKHLIGIQSTWEDEAARLAAQIDYMQLLKGGDPQRWSKLTSYLRAREGRAKDFNTVFILRRDGTRAFAFGPARTQFSDLSNISVQQGLLTGVDRRHVYWLMSNPLWLGDEGQGTMYILHPLENDTLNQLASPDVDVVLLVNGVVTAASAEAADMGERLEVDALPIPGTKSGIVDEQATLLSAESAGRIHMLVRHRFTGTISPLYIAAGVFGLAVAFSLALWLIMGSWIREGVRRVLALSQAMREFTAEHQASDRIRGMLDHTRMRDDELGQVAQASLQMMESVQQHQDEAKIYLQTLDILEEGVVELDRNGNLLRAGGGWSRLTNGEGGKSIYHGVHPEDQSLLSGQLAALFSSEKIQVGGRLRFGHESSGYIWIEYRLIAILSETGTVKSVRGVLRDVTQLYQTEKRIIQMALHDSLTGLPNRILFEDRCKHALGVAKRQDRKVVLGFIDLDHFKNINDTFGHKIGDQMLIAVANVLKSELRAGDTLARWGGDEFVVLLTDLLSIDDARQVAQKLAAACMKPVMLDGQEFNFTLSMGFAMYPDDAESMEALLSQSDRTMFHAKDQGRNTARFFCDMSGKGFGKKEVYIQNRLVAAINNKRIQTWFQPLLEADTRRIIGVEALARWQDTEHGWIPPATFIPMAENIGMIMDLSQQVWLEALRQGRRWRDAGHDLKISINISRRQLFMPMFTSSLLQGLQEFDMSPESIVLEITESIANTDVEHTSRRLKELADMGFTLSIDDFGTGYSSLSVLHDMPVREVKIDMSFVRRVREVQGAQIIQAIMHMAGAFQLNTVAEGVEDEESAQILQSYGVRYLQGYLFGKPMPAEELDELLNLSKQKVIHPI